MALGCDVIALVVAFGGIGWWIEGSLFVILPDYVAYVYRYVT
jgi:hypothetical protein